MALSDFQPFLHDLILARVNLIKNVSCVSSSNRYDNADKFRFRKPNFEPNVREPLEIQSQCISSTTVGI
jgi:hypothetical protein